MQRVTKVFLVMILGLYSYCRLCAGQVGSVNCSLFPCNNGGTCLRSFVSEGSQIIDSFTCHCPPRTLLPLCDSRINVSCDSFNPCMNGGTCSNTGSNQCSCNSGFILPFCSDDCRSAPCQNGGTCTHHGLCLCLAGYTGTSCERNTVDVTCPDTIVIERGSRVTYTASCMIGNFMLGQTCDVSSGTIVMSSIQIRCTCNMPYNHHFCTFIVVANSSPVISDCPDSVTVRQIIQDSVAISYSSPSCTDDDNVITIVADCNPPSGQFISPTTRFVVCTCTDSHGFEDSCTISIPANAPPASPQCPSDMDFIRANGNGVQVTFVIPTCFDEEQQTALTAVCSPTSGSVFTSTVTLVTCTCTDLSGLTSSCSFRISVQGVQCPSDQSVTIQIGSSPTEVTWFEPNNPTSFLVIHETHHSGDLFPFGDTTVTYTFRDQVGSVASCSFTVNVIEDCTALNSNPPCDEASCQCGDEVCTTDTDICSRRCSVFECPAGLQSISLSRGNPSTSVEVSCILTGSRTLLNRLLLGLSKGVGFPLDTRGITRMSFTDINENSRQITYTVSSVTEKEDLYCVLYTSGTFVIGSVNVTGYLYVLPRLSAAPDVIFKSNTSVAVRWEAWDPVTDVGDPSVTLYLPYYQRNSSDMWIPGQQVQSEDTLEFKAENLEVDTVYEFSVAAVRVGENGEGPRSPSVTVKTYCNVPSVTTEVIARLTPSNKVNVSWQLPFGDVICSTGVTKYTVYYKIEGSADDSFETVAVNDTSMRWYILDEETLMRGKNYSFCVTFTTDQESRFSEITEQSMSQIPLISTAPPTQGPPVAIIGAAVGVVVIMVLLLLIVLVLIKRRKGTDQTDKSTPVQNPGDNVYDNPVFGLDAQRLNDQPEPQSSVHDSVDISIEGLSTVQDDGIYGNLEPPQPIKVAEFGKYFKQNSDKFEQEFSILGGSKQEFDWKVAEDPANKKKNRFKNMYTYDHSRVVLKDMNDHDGTDYYNASFIKDTNDVTAYIASQAPNRASLDDFIRMIWEQHVTTVVMVANLFEDGKERCLQYWPETEGSRISFGTITVTWVRTTQCSDFLIRYLTFKKGKATREVQQLHFLTWPDKDTPDHGTALIEFARQSKLLHKGKKYPMLVHCSAGIGRTGTFICLSCMMDVLKEEEYIDVFAFVNKMRQNRISMVQTSKQYVFLYQCLNEYHLTHHTEMTARQMARLNVESHRDSLSEEFELLSELGHDHRKDNNKNSVGKERENIARNRVRNKVPSNRNRVFLMSPGQSNEGNYINASYVKSFQKKDAFITTQSPLPNTIEDFWRMVFDAKSPLVVMLNQLDPSDPTCVQYWPDRGTNEYGNMIVTSVAVERNSGYTQRTFEVSHVNSKDVLSVTHMQMQEWRPDLNLQDIAGLIRDIDVMQKREQFTQPIVIHCINGFERSGVLVTVKSEMERMAITETVDVFSTVKKLRDRHEHMLNNKDEYFLCFHILKTYLASSSNNYENSDSLRRA